MLSRVETTLEAVQRERDRLLSLKTSAADMLLNEAGADACRKGLERWLEDEVLQSRVSC